MGVSFLSNSPYGGRIGYSDNEQEINSSMTMDFRVVTPAVKSITDKSTNQIFLTLKGSTVTYGLSAAGSSLGTNSTHNKQDARHGAIRLLIEKGIIESIGKTEEVPYWKCLPHLETSNQSLSDKFQNSNGSIRNISKANSEFEVYKEIKTQTVGDKTLWNFNNLNESDEGVLHKINRKFTSVPTKDKYGNYKYVPREFMTTEYGLLSFTRYTLHYHHRVAANKPMEDTIVESNSEISYSDSNSVPYSYHESEGKTIFEKVISCNVEGKQIPITKNNDSKKEYCEIELDKKEDTKEGLINKLILYYTNTLRFKNTKNVQDYFINNGIIESGTKLYSQKMYEALYLNLPIENNAKWKI